MDVLRALFEAPERLRPLYTAEQVTERAAQRFADIAASLRARGADHREAAQFLMRLLFCLFAEDIGLLPNHVFTRLVERTRSQPEIFLEMVSLLFRTMATGGWFGVEQIPYFDGGLFTDGRALDLTREELEVIHHASALDWSSIEPVIFGTLFERTLDPATRAPLGAHYTSRADIELIVEPVLMAPLRRRWAEVRAQAEVLITQRESAASKLREGLLVRGRGSARPGPNLYERTAEHQQLTDLLAGFSHELAASQVLDPACGSGNFLYVALKRLLDLENEVISFAARNGVGAFFPNVEPQQLMGIELNPYAHELASVVVWIGYIQWLRDNGFGIPSSPILKPLQTVRLMDAILTYDEAGRPTEPEWPAANAIIGNPPFLGGKRLRTELGDAYVEDLFRVYAHRVPREADLVCYWFEKARAQVAKGKAERAGLLATNSIRGGANRRLLDAIKGSGDIFMAWSDRPWILDGADVRVSMVGFDRGAEVERVLDGAPVPSINADLTRTLDLTAAHRLPENFDLAFMGDTKGGAFDISGDVADSMLHTVGNPNGRSNCDVVH